MIRTSEGVWYSASDLLGWLGCAHRTSLDADAMTDSRLRGFLTEQRRKVNLLVLDDESGEGFISPAAARGDQHERAMLQGLKDSGLEAVEIDRPRDQTADAIRERAEQTAEAMREGADVIFQATLLDPPWFGYADFLVRVDGVPSGFGDYAYEVRDTKLARHATASALIQMAHYGAIVELMQDIPPPRLSVWLGTGEEVSWDYSDAAPYLHEARSRFLAFRADPWPTEPEPCIACASCRWQDLCSAEWGVEDLLHVHRLTRRQREMLREAGIGTIAALAQAPDHARPGRMAIPTFDRLREQASAQVGEEAFAIVRPQPAATSLVSVPEMNARDIYFDLEGDPFAAIPTLDYLWAYCDASGAYACAWAHAPEEELAALEWFLGALRAREAQGGDWHVFHYNSYEVTSLRRVARSHPDPTEAVRLAAEVDEFIERRFVDLYRIVESSVRTRDGSTSLKIVEQLAGYDRKADAPPDAVHKADDSIVEYERYVASEDAVARAAILDGIRDYNTHDVRATLAVHGWLRGLSAQLSDDDVIPAPEPYASSPEVQERIRRTEELSVELREAATSGAPLPSGLSAEGALRLSHMLEWHRAEMIVQFLDRKRLEAWALEGGETGERERLEASLDAQLNGVAEERSRIAPGSEVESVLVDIEFVREIGPKSSRKNAAIVWEYRCRPGSWRVREGKRVNEVLPPAAGRAPLGLTIEWIDPDRGLFRFSRQERPDYLGPLVINDYVDDEQVWESLMRLGRSALSRTPAPEHRLGIAMLDAEAPLPEEDMVARESESASDRARRLAMQMTEGLLPIQGPPGTGKTWVGAHLIADRLREAQAAGRPVVIGITANSHRVINNLMLEAMARCRDEGVPAVFAHVGGKDKIEEDPAIVMLKGGGDLAAGVADALSTGTSVVVGATKFAWARADAAGLADLLLIDEAGQLTLADACAVAQAAPMAIALGDPQQLAAPVQASHDESVDVSLLEHIAGDDEVIPEASGVFLDVTYRMHPDVCRVVADLAYRGELRSSEEAARRSIDGAPIAFGDTEMPVAPGVAWIALDDEHDEVEVTRHLLNQLVGSAIVTDADGYEEVLTWEEVRVVAPHNAHVNRLTASLPEEALVGTVDRFQGQQGHVVVYSMGRLAESPGDVPFLYELNRINVALSRARVLSIVVSHRDAVFPPVSTPDHLLLASRFIQAVRYRPHPTAR